MLVGHFCIFFGEIASQVLSHLLIMLFAVIIAIIIILNVKEFVIYF